MKIKRLLFTAIPLLIFIALVMFLWRGLDLDPKKLPSPLIDKPMPAFRLPEVQRPQTFVSNKDLIGKVAVVNVWATWCLPCRAEHPILMELAEKNLAPIYGLNYKDQRDKAVQWLKDYGNPYVASLSDSTGRVGIDFGVYGVPETFIIDEKGIIRYKHVGPVDPHSLTDVIIPIIKQLQQDAA